MKNQSAHGTKPMKFDKKNAGPMDEEIDDLSKREKLMSTQAILVSHSIMYGYMVDN